MSSAEWPAKGEDRSRLVGLSCDFLLLFRAEALKDRKLEKQRAGRKEERPLVSRSGHR